MLSDRMATRRGSASCGLPPRREPPVIPVVSWREGGRGGLERTYVAHAVLSADRIRLPGLLLGMTTIVGPRTAQTYALPALGARSTKSGSWQGCVLSEAPEKSCFLRLLQLPGLPPALVHKHPMFKAEQSAFPCPWDYPLLPASPDVHDGVTSVRGPGMSPRSIPSAKSLWEVTEAQVPGIRTWTPSGVDSADHTPERILSLVN